MAVPWSTDNPFKLNHLIAFNLCVRFAHIVHYNSLQLGPQDDASGGPVRLEVPILPFEPASQPLG
jgi:hypothetical protein